MHNTGIKITNNNGSDKLIHLEFLRIIACFLVIVNHTEESLYLDRAPSLTWLVGVVYFFICKIAVPLFLMISGAVLLGKTDTYQKTFSRIVKVGVVFLISSAIYYLYYTLKSKAEINICEFCIRAIQSQTTNAFWYFYLYFALLCLTPILQKTVRAATKQDIQWGLFLSVGLLGTVSLVHLFIPSFALSWYFTSSFSTYIGMFLFGYYIEKYARIDCGRFWLSIVLFIILIGFETIAAFCFYQKDPALVKLLDDRNLITITASAVCVYFASKYLFSLFSPRQKVRGIICYVGNLTFGIYLLSDLMIDLTRPIHQFMAKHLHVVIAMLFWEILIFFLSAIIIAGFKRIPFLKKWI